MLSEFENYTFSASPSPSAPFVLKSSFSAFICMNLNLMRKKGGMGIKGREGELYSLSLSFSYYLCVDSLSLSCLSISYASVSIRFR